MSSRKLSLKPSQSQKSTLPSARIRGGKTKQRSITSFFSSTPRSSSAASPREAAAALTPGSAQTAPCLTPRNRSTPTPQPPPQSLPPQQRLRPRTLFTRDEDDVEPTIRRKRRRIVRLDEPEEKDDGAENDKKIDYLLDIDFNDEEGEGESNEVAAKHGNDTKISQEPGVCPVSAPEKEPRALPAKPNVPAPSLHDKFVRKQPAKSPAKQQVVKLSPTNDDEQDSTIKNNNGNNKFSAFRLKRHTASTCEGTMSDVERHEEIALPAARVNAREKLMELSGGVCQVGQEPEGWCSKHKWTVDIRDEQMRRPSDSDYDKSTLYIPPSELSSGAKSLTPFQKQFWDIKRKNFDVVVFFKKGKFYELYDKDADIGNAVLGLNFTKGGRVDMRCCGVPEQAFSKHCGRLVDLGYKVGRVEQTETANAAEKRKKASGSSSTVCERSLVRILTKGTVREEELLRDHRARHVVVVSDGNCLYKFDGGERNRGRTMIHKTVSNSSDTTIEVDDDDDDHGVDESPAMTIGLCFADVASGSINISQFDDDGQLGRTERLITYLAPHEIVIDSSVCSDRLNDIVKWCGRKFNSDVTDVAQKENDGGFRPVSDTTLASYLLHTVQSDNSESLMRRLGAHMKRFKVSSVAFGGLVSYLKSLIIDKETLSLANYNLFPDPDIVEKQIDGDNDNTNSEKTSKAAPSVGKVSYEQTDNLILSTGSKGNDKLYMDASALQNLEVLTTTLGSEQGSLLSFVDRAHTPAGRRLLRKWIAEPLSSSCAINDRLDAVEDLHSIDDTDGGQLLQRIAKLLRSKKDLERALPKLHQFATVSDRAVMFDDTNKRRVKEFVHILRSVEDNLKGLETLGEAIEQQHELMKSKRLKWLCTAGGGFPHDALDKLTYFLGDAFDVNAAEKTGDIIPKAGAVPMYDKASESLKNIEGRLDSELDKWKSTLKDSNIKYYHRGKEPYQLEVKKESVKYGTPDDFEVTSESKACMRFYTATIRTLVRKRVNCLEDFESESSLVAKSIAAKFDIHYTTWAAVSKACAEVDALLGLSRASRDGESYGMCMSRPKILSNDHPNAMFHAKGLRHPILARNMNGRFVANDVKLGRGLVGVEEDEENETDIMILCGPNAGGKSTCARQVALAVILAQIGCFVPAEHLRMRPFRDIFVRMGASDDLARGRSTFMVEMEEVSRMLSCATSESLIIADEVGRGTSTHDGYSIATQVIHHFAKVNRSLAVFSTHYSRLADEVGSFNRAGGLRVGVFEMDAHVDERKKCITFLYDLKKGSSGHSRGVYCARVAGVHATIADLAEVCADKLNSDMEQRAVVHAMMGFIEASNPNDGDDVVDENLRLLLQNGCVVE